MEIRKVTGDKREYLNLLYLADEQDSMLNQYLDRGTMYVLDDDGIKAECVVTDEGDGMVEIKNLAVLPEAQRKGFGHALIRFVEQTYSGKYHTLQVATGDSPITVPYYASNGFTEYCRNKDYIT